MVRDRSKDKSWVKISNTKNLPVARSLNQWLTISFFKGMDCIVIFVKSTTDVDDVAEHTTRMSMSFIVKFCTKAPSIWIYLVLVFAIGVKCSVAITWSGAKALPVLLEGLFVVVSGWLPLITGRTICSGHIDFLLKSSESRILALVNDC